MKNEKDIAFKSGIIFLLFCALGVAIMVTVFKIQFGNDEAIQQRATNYSYKVRDIEPVRGQILSSDGRLLATSVPQYEIRWDSQSDALDQELFKKNLGSLCEHFASVFNDKSSPDYKTPQEYKQLFEKSQAAQSRFARIATKANYHQLKAVQEHDFIKRGKYKSGFMFPESTVRKKPFGALASRTIGIDREHSRVGLELAYNAELEGVKGQRLEQKLSGGIWRPMSEDYITEPVKGLDVNTTIDAHLQDVAHEALYRQMNQHQAEWGTLILMEVETGAVKAIVNLQQDPESGSYDEAYNHAIGSSVEPGSTFKLMSMMAALDDNAIELTDSVDAEKGFAYFSGVRMTDSNLDKGGHGMLSAKESYAVSSNIGVAKLVKRSFGEDPQRFLDKLHSFGLHKSFGLKIKGEGQPNIYDQAGEGNWSGISLTQMAIGYELSMTPLQTLAYYNAIANDGRLMQPQFVSSLSRGGKIEEAFKPEVINPSICRKGTIEECQEMLRAVGEEGGTAYNVFKKSPYHVAGKTGTAWLFENGTYQNRRYRASFVGYFPAEKPKYSCIVVINKPMSGAYYGSSIAAPAFKEMADKIYAGGIEEIEMIAEEDAKLPPSKDGNTEDLLAVYNTLDIDTKGNTSGDVLRVSTKDDHVELSARNIKDEVVPNVKGMGLQDAIYLLESAGLHVDTKGTGTVKTQSIPGGTAVGNYKSIAIALK